MKLYFAPGTCSLSPHIVLREAGLPFTLEQANLQTHTLAKSGADFYGVHAKGYVPLLELDNGEQLSEGPVIVQYIADQVPARQLAPANGTMARYRLQEWLNFIGSELHKGYGFLFNPAIPEDAKQAVRARLQLRYKVVEQALADKPYLTGAQFCVADAYLYAVTRWAPRLGVDLGGLANVQAFQARMTERPAVQAALEAEGLLKT